ncbi:MAG: hypothetical protein IKW58_02140 [Alphaproteobacteria bacterium]|nr:hypothetical protein [Alphaproteobacteria bacterium]
MSKYSFAVFACAILSVLCVVYALMGDKEFSTYAWFGSISCAILCLIGYSCENAATVNDEGEDDYYADGDCSNKDYTEK